MMQKHKEKSLISGRQGRKWDLTSSLEGLSKSQQCWAPGWLLKANRLWVSGDKSLEQSEKEK